SPSPLEVYPLSLHDALPISGWTATQEDLAEAVLQSLQAEDWEEYEEKIPLELLPSSQKKEIEEREVHWDRMRKEAADSLKWYQLDRKSTRLNSSHRTISYAV